jgi:hypothetical protein
MKKKKKQALPTRQDVLRRLGQMAFGETDGAAKLANRDLTLSDDSDLSQVAEVKITDKGTELKLIDRVKALETLWGLLGQGSGDGMEQFLRELKEEDEREGTIGVL